jgi:hypothetical protein
MNTYNFIEFIPNFTTLCIKKHGCWVYIKIESRLLYLLLLNMYDIKSIILVPQNSRNNSVSVGQCQLVLKNKEKNTKKNWGSKGAALISFLLNIKKDFDYI